MSLPARFPGECADCGEKFTVGTLISAVREREWAHENCPDDPRLPDKPVEGCTECFMVKPCMCEYEREDTE